MIITLAEKEEKSAREMMAASPEFDFEAIREIALHNQEYSQRETRSEKWDECEKAWSDFNEAIKNKNLETKQIGEMIDKLLKICPDQAVWYNKGFYFEKLGNDIKALECYDKALEIDGNYVNALANKALILGTKIDTVEEALECFDKIIEIQPDNAKMIAFKGLCLATVGKKEDAVEYLDKALEIDPNNTIAGTAKVGWLFDAGKFEEAEKMLKNQMMILEENDREYFLVGLLAMKGVGLERLEKYDEALECYEKMLEIGEKHPDKYLKSFGKKWILTQIGEMHMKLGRNEEALECYDKVIEIDGENFSAFFNKAEIYHNLNKDVEAIECLDKALEIDGENSIAWNNKAFSLTIILHGLMGADEPALKEIDTMQQEIIKCYEKSNELEPHNAKTLINLGIMYGFQGRFAESEEYLTKALEIDGKLGESLGWIFWQSKAAALEGLKKYDEALECIDEGLEIFPNNESLIKTKERILDTQKREK